jgi:hypothetical protein
MRAVRPGAGAASLPPLFERWMSGLLPGSIPAERHATCDRCAMLPPSGGDARAVEGDPFFSTATKCCTYLPELSNFLVGQILSDTDADSAEGRATVDARIERGLGVTPLGLHRTPLYGLLYQSSPGSFGRARAMRCPHYLEEGGRCGVWRHRESTCATWFCKYGRGWNGRIFWQRLHDTLSMAEDAVRTHCLLELGFPIRALSDLIRPHALTRAVARGVGLSAADVDDEKDPAAYDAVWGEWRGRERELFVACARVAAPLEWPDIQRLGGVRLELLSQLLTDAYRTLVSDAVPPSVQHRRLSVVGGSAETVKVVGYSPMDPLRIPRKLLDVLHHFDGRATEVVLDEIDDQHGLRILPGVVRTLADFDLLTPTGE